MSSVGTTNATLAVSDPDLSIDEMREVFRQWMTDHAAELERFRTLPTDVDEIFSGHGAALQRLLYDAGWVRLGWPADVGGIGGVVAHRALVGEELVLAGYPTPFSFATQEVMGPALARYGSPELRTEFVPRLLRGQESWCQGFSEPGAGSDLGSLRTKAVERGDDWVITGEKIWTSWAQYASRCFVLARTGTQESAHRGITAFFVDMDTPGITRSPLRAITGQDDFSSLHFDNVVVPKARVIGEVNGGWGVSMFILGCERGAAAWQRQAWMRWQLEQLVAQSPDLSDEAVGEAFELISALRLLARRTLRALSAGEELGVRPSFDKYVMSTAEKFLFDAALKSMPERLLLADDHESTDWRNDYLYSRASSIYGGAKEIQRNIIAERILGLPREK
ncbi:acyl-CoA dehydrogenase family protein [Nocardia sp. 348MFTsu5.1]|uniref:acyl-CoA dehydrogenase family protein n=1 Tax=Nocardia sp. 348MFTsu5.1 TaxID=1172185 RepID=UPI00037F649C|nr:acyl-CoA dehydrogenase family protein [Nocardia sp. 348MFTsu5.1]